MAKFPIDPDTQIAALELAQGKPLDGKTREIVTLMTQVENQAYEQGLKDGFIKPFMAVKHTCAPVEQDPKLTEAVQELREMLETSFDKEGLDIVFQNLGAIPENWNWAQKIYVMAKEAFVVGGIFAIYEKVEKEAPTDA